MGRYFELVGEEVRGRKRFSYAVSAVLIKDISTGKNIMGDLRSIKAFSKEEAMGKYIVEVNKQFPDYYVHVRPLVMEIKL